MHKEEYAEKLLSGLIWTKYSLSLLLLFGDIMFEVSCANLKNHENKP